MEMTTAILWLAFTVLFAILGRFFWKESTRSLPPFKVAPRRGAAMGSVQILGTDIDKPLTDFADSFNKYLAEQTSASSRANRTAGYSSYLAAATCFASAAIAAWPILLNLFSK